jgi:hypothetical protein
MMKFMNQRTRPLVAWCVFVLQLHLVGAVAFGQNTPDCGYDRDNPTLAGARQTYQLFFNFACAEQELLDLLKRDNLTLHEKAEAHALLAIVYYLSSPNDPQRADKVREELKSAIRLDTAWTGADEQSTGPEFDALVTEARQMVAREDLGKDRSRDTEQPGKLDSDRLTGPAEKKWHDRWAVRIAGVAVLGGLVFLATSGGGGGGDDDPLPGFPPHPKKRR